MTMLLRAAGAVTVSTSADPVVAGEPMEVTIRFVADHPMEVVGGEVELVRQGAIAHFERFPMGSGATVSYRNSAVLDRTGLDVAGALTAGQHLVRQVTLRVPPEEATIVGYLVQQEYAVRAQLRVPHEPDPEGATPVRVVLAVADRGWVADTAPVVDDAGFAALGIEELSSRRLIGGVPISGTVSVSPQRAGSARGVRVELVLDELVPPRVEGPTEEVRRRTTVVAAAPVAGDLDLQPGRVLRLPFDLRAPLPLPAPSMSTPEYTLRWLLRAVLDRPRHRDPTSTIELWASTAS